MENTAVLAAFSAAYYSALVASAKSRDREKMGSGTLWHSLELRIANALNLARRPVAVAFLDAVPSGLEQFHGTEPSGWFLATGRRGKIILYRAGKSFQVRRGSLYT